MHKFLGSYQVIPSLPENLERLREIAYNLYWSWSPDSRELFRRLDQELWDETNHNPVMLLGRVSQERLEEVSHDDGFLSHLERVSANLNSYLNDKTLIEKKYPETKGKNIIYFSAEFGLTECLQTYSGGLGILSGDHLKACSDLGIPLIGVGLLYKEGYFQQYLTSDGWQQERYEINDFENLPMQLVKENDGKPMIVSVSMGEKEVYFQVWNIQVGRIPLYLMDTNISNNSEEDRKITETLYGGNSETRIKQEIILGIGGIRTMHTLGIKPMVCHMNEGHSAFMALERIKVSIKNEGLSFDEAKEVGYYSNIFTTHTPVPAGIDVFSNELVEKYFGPYYRSELKISDKEFYNLGNIYNDKNASSFNMAHLAMNTSGYVNGVSRLHGEVSKKMWVSGYKDIPFNEIPIEYITNGVHMRSHISGEMENLLFQYLGQKWIENPANHEVYQRVDKIPDEELWRTHERRRERLVAFARRRLKKQIKSRGGSQSELAAAAEVLDPTALTIGFARRFATYKRATLMFRNIERLYEILNSKDMPVQFIIAGKAHPQDLEGKKLIQQICLAAKDEQFRRKIVFIENYDMNVARYLVEGCDIWLNTPRRPLEASGTSGMKVIANGGLNFSILDGWWDEGFDPEIGWKIGNGEEYEDHEYQDEVESGQFYNTLETSIIPLFYDRGEDRIPRKWIEKVKNSIKKLGPAFNTHRMVQEYFDKFYKPSFDRRGDIEDKKWKKAKDLSVWKKNVLKNWSKLKVIKIESDKNNGLVKVGQEYLVKAEIDLGNLTPSDVEVQLYFGPYENKDYPQLNSTVEMETKSVKTNPGVHNYQGKIICRISGQQGFTVRILPKNPLLISQFDLGVVHWAQ
ncbi:MAG TPA: alpha-glucan family phosphorylase [Ignavibacteriaceae bacterium]|nr:alpha-glucan family phosphorylase [Ignavibacteriaceae bacterium]